MKAKEMIDATYCDKWKDTLEAKRALENALYVVGNGWWPHADRYTDIVELIEETDRVSCGMGALRAMVEGVSNRAYETSLTEYYLEMVFGFNAEPFIDLNELGERLCERFDATLRNAAAGLMNELYEADDEEPEWWVAVNAAAVEATKATLAWLEEVKLLKERLGETSERGLAFFE